MDKMIRARGYKTFFMLNSTEHDFFLLINAKIQQLLHLTFMSGKNSILCLSEPKQVKFLDTFLYICVFQISCSTELSMKKRFVTSGPDCSCNALPEFVVRLSSLDILKPVSAGYNTLSPRSQSSLFFNMF